MKLESRIEHAASLAWLEWVMKEYGQKMPEPVGAFFNHVAKMVDAFERVHYPMEPGAPGNPLGPCFDCDHIHEGPIVASPYDDMPAGRACLKCACKVRT